MISEDLSWEVQIDNLVKKAFDLVLHKRLVHKLAAYGEAVSLIT